MTSDTSQRDPVEALADSFLERLRRGEHPAVSEYVQIYPELADEIRDLFPTLAMVERLGPEPARDVEDAGHRLVGEAGPLRQVGEYRIIREIGRGGMGVVYEAEQESLGRHVALKVLPAHAAADPMHLKRFHREAKAAARLHHTNIVPVYDVGVQAGVYYYAMQFIQGQGLDEVFVELRRLRGHDEATRPKMPATETFAEPLARAGEIRGELTNTIVRGLVLGQFERAKPESTEWDERSESVSPAGLPNDSLIRNPAARAPMDESSTSDSPDAHLPANDTATRIIARGVTSGADGSTVASDADRAHDRSSVIIRGQLADVSESHQHYFQSVARLGLQVAEALAHAHGQGVLHRDIKPSNLILDTAGVIWVTDFGLAKNEGDNLTHTGDVVGTLRYMAPERFRGRTDARSDIYSLGLTIYEFLTLQPVLPETDRARLVQSVLQTEPPRPRAIDRHVPRDLETIVLKAIDKDPQHRYATAAEFADDLSLFLADKPIQARRASIVERTWRWCRRNPVVAGLAASVLSLLTVIAVGASVSALKLRGQATELSLRANQLSAERNNAVENLRRAEAAEGLANRRLFESYRNEARAGRWSRRAGQRFDSLTAIRNAAELLPDLGFTADELDERRLDLRNQAIASMALPDLRRVTLWPSERRRTAWAFDPNVERYARGDMEGNVSVRRLIDDVELVLLPGFGLPAWSARFSHDGRYLAARYEHNSPAKLYVWDLSRRLALRADQAIPGNHGVGSESQPTLLTDDAVILKVDEVARADAIAFSPDDSQIAMGRFDRSVSIHRLGDGQELSRFTSSVPPADLHFDPSGNKLAIASSAGRPVQIRHLDTGKVESLRQADAVQAIAWHPDGKLLATACDDRRAYLWDTDTGQRRAVFEGHEQPVVGVCFDPTGRHLATSTYGTTRLWDVASGVALLAVEGQCGHFSSDGHRLGSVVGWDVGMWEVVASRELRTLPTGAWAVDFDQAGSVLAAATNRGVEMWGVDSGSRIAIEPIGKSMSVAFHPSGRELIASGPQAIYRLPVTGPLAPLNVEATTADHVSQPEWSIGTPRKVIDVAGSEFRSWLDLTGCKLGVNLPGDHAAVFDLNDPTKRVRLQPHPRHHYVALSPDGRWAATGTFQGNGVRVCDATTGELAADLIPDGVSATVAFSPDGKWLVSGSGIEYCFFEVGTWQLRHRVARDRAGNRPGHIAFARDGSLGAIAHSRPLVELIDPHTGRLFATLEPPNPGTLGWLSFAPDGSYLAAVTDNTIHLWDVRRIREQLAEMRLDWGN